MGVGHGERAIGSSWFPRVLNPLLARSLNIFQAANQSSGGEKNYIVYSLLCIIFIIIVIIITIYSIISSISISFVALLNCLFPTHKFPLLSISYTHPTAGGRGGVSERLSSA